MTVERPPKLITFDKADGYYSHLRQVIGFPDEHREYRLNPLTVTSQTSPLVVNPITNGYRQPSPYSASLPISCLVKATWPEKQFVSYDIHGRKVEQLIQGTSRAWGISYGSMPWPKLSDDWLWMKARNGVRDEMFDLSMTLAEIQATTTTVITQLNRVARSMEVFRRRHPDDFRFLLRGGYPKNMRKTARRLRITADRYLEWKYGIMPSVYDIQGGIQSLAEVSNGTLFGRAPVMTARARIKAETEHSFPVAVQLEGLRAQGTARMRLYAEKYARIDYSVDCDMLRGLNRYGVGWSSLATVPFERTPFTFVLNMAIPIADLIKAWGALAGVSVVGISYTDYKRAESLPIRDAAGLYVPLQRELHVDLSTTERASGFTRIRPKTVPIPMPFVKNPISTGNSASILSLFTSLRGTENEILSNPSRRKRR